jgi:hypothetical protein
MRRSIFVLVATILVTPSLANAAGVVMIGDARVSQYREALGGAREVLHDPPVVDPAAADAAEQVKRLDPTVALVVGQKALQLVRYASKYLRPTNWSSSSWCTPTPTGSASSISRKSRAPSSRRR